MQPVEPLCLRFAGILYDDMTGARIDVTFTYTLDDDGAAALTVDVHGRETFHQCGAVAGSVTRVLHHRCFGDPPPGERQPRPTPRPPINFDGTPRNRVQDRLRERWDRFESTAAD